MSSEQRDGKQQPTLILHLDVNKTLIFTDKASGHSLEGLVNSTIASRTFGTINDTVQPPIWTPVLLSSATSTCSPLVDINALYSYDAYVREILLPYKDIHQKSDGTTLTSDEQNLIVEENKQIRKQRIQLTTVFTEINQPGEQFREEYLQLLSALQLSSEDISLCKSKPELNLLVELQTRFLFPSYFQLLLWLLETKRKFLIIFRTFGQDLIDVITEHNIFVQGNHPLYPISIADNSLLPGLSSLIVPLPYNTGMFIRQGTLHTTDSKLITIIGTNYHDNNSNTTKLTNIAHTTVNSKEYIQPHVNMIMGYHDIYNYFLSLLPNNNNKNPLDPGTVVGIRDDYVAWFSNGQKGHVGKLMPFDIENKNIHSIFFDDNCGDDKDAFVTMNPRLSNYGSSSCTDPRILDPRIITNSKSLTWPEVRNIYAVTVDPYSAVLDKDYFIKAIEMCEKNRSNI